jgi:hypothetical protein
MPLRSCDGPDLLIVALFVAVMCAGCGEPNPLGRRAVRGVVSFQGKPVDYGAITFLPEDTQRGVNTGGKIEGGKYSIEALQGLPPGSYQVMISSGDQSQQTKVEEMPGDVRMLAAERIPKKYNLETTLKIDVPKARGAYQADFDLK